MQSKRRDDYWDELKGIGIILVIIGHIIQFIYEPETYDYNIIFRIIYSFHMPLFFVISGYVLQKYKSKLDMKWLGYRILGLIVPFFSWAIVGTFIQSRNDFGGALIKKILYPDNGLWFLWVLAIINIYIYICTVISHNSKYKVSYYIIFNIILYIIPLEYFGYSSSRHYFTFFALGFLMPQYWENLCAKEKRVIEIFCAISFLILVPFWMRSAKPLFYNQVIESFIYLPVVFTKFFKAFCKIYSNYLVSIPGALSVIFFYRFVRFNGNSSICIALRTLGKHTLAIYVMQDYFVKISLTKVVWIDCIVAFIFAIIVPLYFERFIRKSKWISLFLLGDCSILYESRKRI